MAIRPEPERAATGREAAAHETGVDPESRGTTGRRTGPAFGPSDRIDHRPFTHPEQTQRDVGIMQSMLVHEREIVSAWAHHETGMYLVEDEIVGSRQMLALPDPDALQTAHDVTAVGFFGHLRAGVDHAVLFDHEREIAQTFPRFARLGFLSYFDKGPEHGHYGNLILFTAGGVPAEWRDNPAHQRATEIAPRHYDWVRLHKGRIRGPFMGRAGVDVEQTYYLDFRAEPIWQGWRTYAESRQKAGR
jgi:hypothetical protein